MRIAGVVAALLLCACGSGQDRSSPDVSIDRELAVARDAAAKSSDGKVTICHIPPGNPANAHEITVGEPALDAHIRQHGDRVGHCCVKAGAACSADADCCQDQGTLVCRV
ncbi:MAG TPA: hypothetical protein VE964_03010, partial [Myxococcales bacterium]|nr:hypothetical protein [Myxococcales bacterium]